MIEQWRNFDRKRGEIQFPGKDIQKILHTVYPAYETMVLDLIWAQPDNVRADLLKIAANLKSENNQPPLPVEVTMRYLDTTVVDMTRQFAQRGYDKEDHLIFTLGFDLWNGMQFTIGGLSTAIEMYQKDQDEVVTDTIVRSETLSGSVYQPDEGAELYLHLSSLIPVLQNQLANDTTGELTVDRWAGELTKALKESIKFSSYTGKSVPEFLIAGTDLYRKSFHEVTSIWR